MFNDDPYGRQRQKNQVAVGGAPVLAKPAGLTRGVPAGLNVPPPLNPVQIPQNDVIAPKLRRDAATFAPITNHFSPDAAARQLVDQRLAASGQPMPSDMTPFAQRAPRPGDAGLIARANQAPAAPMAQSTAPAGLQIKNPPGLSLQRTIGSFGGLPQTQPSAAHAAMTHQPQPGQNFNVPTADSSGVVRRPDGYVSALDPSAPRAPVQSPMPSGARRSGGRPDLGQSIKTAPTPADAQQNTYIAFRGDPNAGKANEAAPGQVALSERRTVGGQQLNSGFYRDANGATRPGTLPTVGGTPLPGAPLVGADGSVQYDQAWVDKNKALIADYAGRVMPMGTPAPGVAASMVTGGVTPQFGQLQRAPRGFTAEDRARQSEAITERGNAFRTGAAADYAKTQGRMALASGDIQRAGAIGQQATIESGMQVAPPITTSQAMATQRLAGQKQAVDQGNDAAKLAMDQEAQAVLNEQNKAQTETQQMQLANAKQMDQLRQQIINGTPEQSQAAIKTMTALSGPSKTGFIKVKVPVPTGIGPTGERMFGDGEMLVNEATGAIAFDPRTSGGAMPSDEDIALLRKNPSAEMKAFFKETYGVDPAQYVN